MGVVVVVNPHAGGGRGGRVLETALPLLRERGLAASVRVCRDGLEPRVRAQEAAETGADLVIALGGDGHAAAVAGGLIGTATSLAVLPAGSANDYARAIGMPIGDPRAAVEAIADGRQARVDVVRVAMDGGVRHFLNVGGTGFDAAVVQRVERIPMLRGGGRYALAVLRELMTFRPADLAVCVDGVTRDTSAMMVAVANGSTYGGGMRVAPDARLDSGTLDVCVVGRISRLGFVRAFPLVYRGRHVGHRAVTMLRGREVSIDGDARLGVTGDGDLIGRLPASFSVLPACLSVVVGRNASGDAR